MRDLSGMDRRYLIFAHIFLLSNRLQTDLDGELEEVTAKQWFVMIAQGAFEEPPTLGELARICGSSHQNTKQLVKKLAEKGYLRVEPDGRDGRAVRIARTAQGEALAAPYRERGAAYLQRLFEGLTEEELETFYRVQEVLCGRLERQKDGCL